MRHATALGLAVILAACTGPDQTAAPTGGAPPTTAPTATELGTPTAGVPSGPPTPTAAPIDLTGVSVTLEPFATVPGPALAMAAPDDGTGRLFVATQNGFIWLVEADGQVRERPMVDLDPQIASGGERGLLGIALHPDFPDDPRIFVDYTDNNGDTVVASLTLAQGDANRFDEGSRRRILFVEQPFANHNGGALAFGPDGYLYVSLGDGGGGGDPNGNGQRLEALLGKILRIDVDAEGGGRRYAIPADNPYAGGGGAPEIWSSGMRNPWRMSFDRELGDLWIGDVGQGAWEEIDVAPAGTGGLNFGWNTMEGAHCYGDDACDQGGLTLPVSEYGRDQGCTVIGGNVYRGAAYPFLTGAYLFADYCTGHIFAIDASVRQLTAPAIVGNGSNQLAAWGEDTGGELYLMNLDGTVSRVVATQR
jgi:glucose/arabinose dehydrogenase